MAAARLGSSGLPFRRSRGELWTLEYENWKPKHQQRPWAWSMKKGTWGNMVLKSHNWLLQLHLKHDQHEIASTITQLMDPEIHSMVYLNWQQQRAFSFFIIQILVTAAKSHSPQKSTNINQEIVNVLSEFLVIHPVERGRNLVCTSERLKCICQSQLQCRICLPLYKLMPQSLSEIYKGNQIERLYC